ncbi:MAG: protein kinase [Labilithrix sp.]|nr:protein kinase [Labilithrix sp.]
MLKPGDLVGPYEIRGFVGQGGMGQVYQAFDPRLERTVALKVIVVPEQTSPNDSAKLSGEFSARLLREARAVASLSHPNVVGVFDVGESSGRLFLAMEFVVGATLRKHATDGEVPLARKLRWLVDIARALEVAHRAGLIHRDVKPENVMIREDGMVKVLDFGIARRSAAAGADPHAQDTVTGGGAIAGTPVYMAPEQIKGRAVDARCDQFAWGVTAYELLVGERPWSDTGDVLQLVAKVLTDPPPPIQERAKDVPQVVRDTILRALSKDPDARFPTMADVADALEPYATQSSGERVRITPRAPHFEDHTAYAATTRVPTSVSVSPEPPARTSEAPASKNDARRRRKITQLALPIGLTCLLGIGVYAAMTRTPPIGPTPNAPRPLSTVPEADRELKEAMLSWRAGRSSKALASLERAVELDPTFAAAHLELAIQTAHVDPARAQASYQSAFEHRQMLTKRDAELLRASEPYIRPKPDLDEWETLLTSAVFQFPRDAALHLWLGRARERQGNDDAAKAAYEKAVFLDPDFVPGLAALANAERNLGNAPEALQATDRCTKKSPVATTCIETRYRVLSETGECHRAREEAGSWRTLEPQSPQASAAFARALFADGVPRPGVEEALSRAWAMQPPAKRERTEIWDRMNLAVIDGELSRAEALARDYDAALPKDADRSDHSFPARLRVNVLYEADQLKAAAKAAHDFLDRMDAWAPYPFASDPSIGFYEPLYRNGEITKAALDEQRTRWIAREKQRTSAGDHTARAAWSVWTLWGGFAETREEADDALTRLPRGVPLPVGMRRAASLDFVIGKVYALVGRPAEAIPALLNVTGSCAALEDALIVMRARYYLGMAYEAKGDKALAKAAYERTLATWPKGTRSRTLEAAKARLEALK